LRFKQHCEKLFPSELPRSWRRAFTEALMVPIFMPIRFPTPSAVQNVRLDRVITQRLRVVWPNPVKTKRSLKITALPPAGELLMSRTREDPRHSADNPSSRVRARPHSAILRMAVRLRRITKIQVIIVEWIALDAESTQVSAERRAEQPPAHCDG